MKKQYLVLLSSLFVLTACRSQTSTPIESTTQTSVSSTTTSTTKVTTTKEQPTTTKVASETKQETTTQEAKKVTVQNKTVDDFVGFKALQTECKIVNVKKATIYGDYQNQLSIHADVIEANKAEDKK